MILVPGLQENTFFQPPSKRPAHPEPFARVFAHHLEKFFASSDETFRGWFGPYVTSCNCMLSIKKLKIICLPKIALSFLLFSLLSSSEAPAGYPNKNSNYRKKQKAHAARWKEEKGFLLPLVPLPVAPGALSFSFFPASYDTKESLSKGVFERRTSTGSEAFSLLTCLDDIKFVFLSFFTVIEAI